MKAVENGGTSIGIRCKDGVVLAVEKIVTSKLLKPGANKRIATVDRHLGVVSTTRTPSFSCHPYFVLSRTFRRVKHANHF